MELGSPYHIEIDALAETGMGIIASGTIRFRVVYEADGSLVPQMTVTPDMAVMERGFYEGDLIISGPITSLSGITVEVEFQETPLSGARQRTAAPSRTKRAIKILPLPSDEPNGWMHPLGEDGSVVAISGTFGEWPGHGYKPPKNGSTANPPHIHEGIDLARSAGVSVMAAKSGVVASSSGSPLSLRHNNGVFSRYLHVNPLLKADAPVTRGQRIATIRAMEATHLHFEVSDRFTASGNARNPVDIIPSLAQGDSAAPEIRSIILRHENLASNEAGDRSQAVDDDFQETVYVGIGARDFDSRNRNNVLALRSLEFHPEGGAAMRFDLTDLTTINAHFQNPMTFGYPRLTNSEFDRRRSRNSVWYQYWFPWNLKRTGLELSGPARFSIRAADAAGNSTSHSFAFGPEIQNKSSLAAIRTRQVTATLKSFLGPFPLSQSGIEQLEESIELKLTSSPAGIPNAVFANNNQSVSRIDITITPSTGTGSKEVAILLPSFDRLPNDATFTLEARSKRCPSVGDSCNISIIKPDAPKMIVGAILRLNSIALARSIGRHQPLLDCVLPILAWSCLKTKRAFCVSR